MMRAVRQKSSPAANRVNSMNSIMWKLIIELMLIAVNKSIFFCIVIFIPQYIGATVPTHVRCLINTERLFKM